MKLLFAILKHKLAWNKEVSLIKIKDSISGVVDVKLAQFLSNFALVVGEDVAKAFRTLTHEAPSHPDEYSKRVVAEDFGDAYDLDGSTLVGSGSIAQVHKLAKSDLVIKVVHPHAVEEVENALEAYCVFRKSWYVSSKLKVVCDVFFEGLVAQLDMRNERVHAGHFPSVDRYITPEPVDASKRCLVMRYEPATHLSVDDIPHKVLKEAYTTISRYSSVCLERGWIHADMHQGNFGIRYDEAGLNTVVVYDFGFVYDLTDEVPEAIRKEMSNWSDAYDFERHKNALIQVMGVDEYDTTGMDLTPKIEPFTRNIERLVFYYFTMCEINPTSFKLMSSMEKYYPYAQALIEMERN